MYQFILTLVFVSISCAECVAQTAGPVELGMEPLPQKPIAAKGASDLVDEGLRGKVKMVIVESSDISQQSVVGSRQMSHLMLFNEKGSLVQQDYYSRGNPYSIWQYGYIDGKRVSKSRSITYSYDPPPPPAPLARKDNSPRDTRYQYAYQTKYADGQLVEEILISNNGKVVTRTVHNRSKDQIERLVYTSNDELNQKYSMKIDQKGNVIEETTFGLRNYDIYGDWKYRFTYEFDKQGNWVKKEASREVLENGKAVYKPAFVQFRTITYF